MTANLIVMTGHLELISFSRSDMTAPLAAMSAHLTAMSTPLTVMTAHLHDMTAHLTDMSGHLTVLPLSRSVMTAHLTVMSTHKWRRCWESAEKGLFGCDSPQLITVTLVLAWEYPFSSFCLDIPQGRDKLQDQNPSTALRAT
jgi:hypothetical protein